jgi:hypothetical protein
MLDMVSETLLCGKLRFRDMSGSVEMLFQHRKEGSLKLSVALLLLGIWLSHYVGCIYAMPVSAVTPPKSSI